MTVTYTADIATGGRFASGCWTVMIRWRGSLYKLIWKDFLCYCIVVFVINYIEKNALSSETQVRFQQFKAYISSNLSTFPISFGLNFFVDQVVKKWWELYQTLPSPDTLAIFTNATIPGNDDQSRMIRRTIVRYAVLSLVLTLRTISIPMRKRFPTMKHVEEAGFLMEDENIHHEKLEGTVFANSWIPLAWAANIATRAKTYNMVTSDDCLRLLITELTAHRNKLGTLVCYDLVNIPLVYTQTMVVMVMSYVVLTQPISFSSDGNGTLMNFIVYVGLMKVAAVMLNPFGEDDDDFELNAIVDRHLKAAYMIVDEMHEEQPEVVKDAYWDEIVPSELLYTVGSVASSFYYPESFDSDIPEPSKIRSEVSQKAGGSVTRAELSQKSGSIKTPHKPRLGMTRAVLSKKYGPNKIQPELSPKPGTSIPSPEQPPKPGTSKPSPELPLQPAPTTSKTSQNINGSNIYDIVCEDPGPSTSTNSVAEVYYSPVAE